MRVVILILIIACICSLANARKKRKGHLKKTPAVAIAKSVKEGPWPAPTPATNDISCEVGRREAGDNDDFPVEQCASQFDACQTKIEQHGTRFRIIKSCAHNVSCDAQPTCAGTNNVHANRVCYFCCYSNGCNDDEYSNLQVMAMEIPATEPISCQVGRRETDDELNFEVVECPADMDSCETKVERQGTFYVIMKACQHAASCSNRNTCIAGSEENGVCYFCCDSNECNTENFLDD